MLYFVCVPQCQGILTGIAYLKSSSSKKRSLWKLFLDPEMLSQRAPICSLFPLRCKEWNKISMFSNVIVSACGFLNIEN